MLGFKRFETAAVTIRGIDPTLSTRLEKRRFNEHHESEINEEPEAHVAKRSLPLAAPTTGPDRHPRAFL